jgi:hypothetical protein
MHRPVNPKRKIRNIPLVTQPDAACSGSLAPAGDGSVMTKIFFAKLLLGHNTIGGDPSISSRHDVRSFVQRNATVSSEQSFTNTLTILTEHGMFFL